MTHIYQEVEYANVFIYRIQAALLPDEVSPFLQFHFFEKGVGNAEVNGKLYSVIPPCILCLSEKDTAMFPGEKAQIYSIYFHPVMINSEFHFQNIRSLDKFQGNQALDIYWLFPFLHHSGLKTIGPATGKRIKELLEAISKELEEKKGTYWPCRTRSFFYELLNLILSVGDKTPNQMEIGKLNDIDSDVQNIIQYLNENYHHKITISKICEIFALNRTSLAEKFKKNTGMTLVNYLTKIRIHMACTLLRDTSLLIYEIMLRVGYEDATHFGRSFRKLVGKPPSKYRKEHKK